MARKHIFVDKTELVLIYLQKKEYISINLTFEQIISIRFSPCKEINVLFPVDSERIEIVSCKYEQPFIYTRLKEKAYFDGYKEELAAFAARNRVSFSDYLQSRK